MLSRKNVTVINITRRRAQSRVRLVLRAPVEFRSVFRAMSRKFKILAIPNVLAHGKSYKHAFAKKCDGHKHYAMSRPESSFDWFYVHHLRNSKYWPFTMY
ncbi:hypothetical protein B296_00057747 [Ensete ventricosum]|uniref:Uncharacterized protein n=1 Tax=Ensete ventricosum TaxID=4639 RepID=A0A426WVB8_ENSVE|nr:hypothetical protein B296_00057747 [Ensete ventricosum]